MTTKPETAEAFAERLVNVERVDDGSVFRSVRFERLITARDELIRAEAREAALKEAVEACERIDGGRAGTGEYGIGRESARDACITTIDELLTSPPPRVDALSAACRDGGDAVTKAELEAEIHALSSQLLDLARRGNVGFVLMLWNGKGELTSTTNLTEEQRREFVGEWLNSKPVAKSLHGKGRES